MYLFKNKPAIKFLLLISISILLLIPSCKKEDEISFINDWDEDINYFSNNLKIKHINLFHNITEAEFNQDIATLRANTSILSNIEINIELFKIISKIGDSHTSIGGISEFSTLPYKVDLLSDGLFITDISIENQQYLGEKIISINGIEINTVLDGFRAIIANENESCFKWIVSSYLRISELFNYFGYSDTPNSITLNLESGNSIILTSGTDAMVSIYTGIIPPLFLSNTTDYYWYQKLDNNSILYIQYNRCSEQSDISFQTFTNQVSDIVNQYESLNKIVIDLRLNSGGNSSIAKPLIELLQYFVNNERISSENIYVIIGRKTFSSAVLNSIELKGAIAPVFIGEPTGGKPNHYGEVESFLLPNSQLEVRYSTKYFNWIQGDPSSIIPDVLIEFSSQDLINGHDPILDYIISH
ncbi:MAG: hypothetical protein HQ521_03955 [Bacteroidetes bacterium]|nr:hypothetical protein [Bacteroidota bacterium]